MRKLIHALILTLLVPVLAFAEVPSMEPEPAKTDITEARLIGAMKSIQPGQKFWVALHLKIKDGWHTYWVNPGDSGVPPTMKWTLPNGFAAGDINYLPPDRHNYIEEINYGYSREAYFLVPITAPDALRANASYIAAVKASWLVCADQCIPESAELSLVLRTNEQNKSEPGPNFDKLAGLVSKLAKPVSDPLPFNVKEGTVRIQLPDSMTKNAKRVEFYPVQPGIIVNKAVQMLESGLLSMPRGDDALPPKFEGIISVYDAGDKRRDYSVSLGYSENLAVPATAAQTTPIISDTATNTTPPTPTTASKQTANGEVSGIWEALLFAILGGLILNAMPCVFPVLSLKALDIARQSHGHKNFVKQRGLAYTVGVILSFFLMALALVAIQSAGGHIGWGTQFQSPLIVGLFAYFLFLIGLNLSGAYEFPMLFGNVGNTHASKHSLAGSFFTGVLAVLVATPCTVPFMGAAIGYAFTQSAPVVLIIFIGMGFGMALPFLLFSFFPKLATKLPKPGEWMETFRNALAFPMYLSVLWLLWVLGQQTNTDMICVVILGFILMMFTIWIWQMMHRSELLVRIGVAIPLIFLCLVPLWFLPVASHMQDAKDCKSAVLLEHGEPFTKARLDELRGQGKPIFVNATASWCLTCQINDRTTLRTKAVMDAISEKQITYLVADWTNRNEEITAFLDSFGRKGVPLYVYYPASGDGVVLPQLLTPSIVLDAINK